MNEMMYVIVEAYTDNDDVDRYYAKTRDEARQIASECWKNDQNCDMVFVSSEKREITFGERLPNGKFNI